MLIDRKEFLTSLFLSLSLSLYIYIYIYIYIYSSAITEIVFENGLICGTSG